ncbi:glutamate--cysteine ligase [Legionella taurinensis]|uniref:Putative glutamate--cysteine ligase 2 n=1 Tax=Legionella taurinensis TaxID=70611 RepID=A0A3A5L2W5_9GAMM|nr:YbdK family carboxylate-amine ligase [Legionella taurinensis]MDX1836353.1 YbdK family carboxylate-amine ligase [Legionella taurinensis]PUT41898.1 glutamate--cysteine ligase [Legionella taurinensis]PUT44687.1 glutamate--cysteine ligase [Legionella taurinensis]PUT48007.1 glutamate--cysteine ligase [Legionella taurinensis]PUT48820.1 glutamate--cysteine ligase [Legionella taurinensis]
MRRVPFKKSLVGSIGVELEFQIVSPQTYTLIPRAKDLIRSIRESDFSRQIIPEITQSMIEINSSVHHSPAELLREFAAIHDFLMHKAEALAIRFCGGGVHPFQRWNLQKIFPTLRYKNLSQKYRYLSKRSTVFGQHIHVGCASARDALYLTHALGRYVPQFIALSACSPFYQGVDTGYYSSRSTIFTNFPMSGVIPYFLTWEEFSDYFYKLRRLGVIKSMKDFYWDVRPKPEFGTVEIRVCDTPLSMKKAVDITAYVQALVFYLLREKPITISHDLYYLYNYNRFQASRYGYEGEFIHPDSQTKLVIRDDILHTWENIQDVADELNSREAIERLLEGVKTNQSDALYLRDIYKEKGTYPQVVAAQCQRWAEPLM